MAEFRSNRKNSSPKQCVDMYMFHQCISYIFLFSGLERIVYSCVSRSIFLMYSHVKIRLKCSLCWCPPGSKYERGSLPTFDPREKGELKIPGKKVFGAAELKLQQRESYSYIYKHLPVFHEINLPIFRICEK